MGPGGGLTIFHGTKDTLICGCYGQQPFLLSGRVPNAPKVCRRVKGHEMDWVRACKENASSRVQTKSNFSEAGPFNEMIMMGVLFCSIPTMVVFFILQKQFAEGITGAVK